MKKPHHPFGIVILRLAVVSVLTASIANAAVYTWNGGGTTGNFSDANNWGGTAPVFSVGNTLTFDGNLSLNATNDIGFNGSFDQSYTFAATALAFTIRGNNIRSGGVVNSSAYMQTINENLLINGTRTFNVGSAGLTMGTPVGSTSTSGRTATKTGSGDLIITGGTAFGGGASYSVSAGRLIFNGSTATSLGTAATGVSLANATSLILSNSGTLTMGGSISTVSGASVILHNTGAATITGGTTIASGASFTGVGSLLGGTVSVLGSIAPGDSGIGSMSFASLSLGSGSTVTMDLDRAATQTADLLSASGALTYGGSLVVDNLGGSLLAGDSFTLFSGILSGSFTSTSLPTLDAGLQWDTTQLDSSGVISVIAVPEPASAAFLGLGAIAVICQIRRRNSR